MTTTDPEKQLEIVSKKVAELEALYELSNRNVPMNDILLLLRYTQSLEKQIRQLQEDVNWLINEKAGPRPEVIGGKRVERK